MPNEALLHESIWFDKHRCEELEERYQEHLNGVDRAATSSTASEVITASQVNSLQAAPTMSQGSSTSVKEIAEARRKIQQTLSGASGSLFAPSGNDQRLEQLESENKELRKMTNDLTAALKKLELRVSQLESGKRAAPAPTPAKEEKKEPPKEEKKEEPKKEDSDDSDEDLFGSDSEEEDEEAERIKQERLAAYKAKKAKKPALIAKSNIILDVKPWDDETDMEELERQVRSVSLDGLLWGTGKLVPIAYGIKKLQISCVVEDDKVGTDLLEEKLGEFEDLIQSIDIVAFNKV